jgi:uncharacterized integral membrane protein
VTPASNPAPSTRSTQFRIRPRLVLVLLIILLVAVFIGQNRDLVDIELFTMHVIAPLWITLSMVTVLGLIVGVLLRRRN